MDKRSQAVPWAVLYFSSARDRVHFYPAGYLDFQIINWFFCRVGLEYLWKSSYTTPSIATMKRLTVRLVFLTSPPIKNTGGIINIQSTGQSTPPRRQPLSFLIATSTSFRIINMSLTLPSPDTGNVSHTRGHDPRTSTLHPIPRKTSNQSSQASASSSQRTLSSSTSHTKSINLHDFKCVAFIGKGSFGTVHCIEHKPSGLRAALKMMKKYPNVWPGYFEDLPEDVREKEKIRIRKITWTNIVNESVALQKLHGQKHVLQLHAAFQDADNFYLLT
ncbi:hypothetical protein ABKN59_007806, partial [Abortiporus biennis]